MKYILHMEPKDFEEAGEALKMAIAESMDYGSIRINTDYFSISKGKSSYSIWKNS